MPSRRSFFKWLSFLGGGGLLKSQVVLAAKKPIAPQPDRTPTTSTGGKPASRGPTEDPAATQKTYDLVIVGGGISGLCASISAARHGVRTALVHNRAMLGGNSSSEVKLYPENSTTKQPWIKEAGIIEELCNEDRARNHREYLEGTMNCIWDLVLYDWVYREKNIDLYLNTHMHRAVLESPSKIEKIFCFQVGTEKTYELAAPLFVDASGDGYLGYRAGADYRWGYDVRSDYNEPVAPVDPTEGTMGNTQFFTAFDTGQPVPFTPPEWARSFPTNESMGNRGHSHIHGGYWWIEVGTPYHPIHDNDQIVHEGLRNVLGVWDHIKNHGDHQAENYGLEFLGFWPYKREARRILGDYVLTQTDLQQPEVHADDVAYGAWPIDIHNPGGILKPQQPPYDPPYSDEHFDKLYTLPYGIPLRALYSRNIENLMMAGRPISASYVAFSSSRVLRTGAIVGQAVGVAASLCKKYQVSIRTIAQKYASECQQLILRDDGHIPGVVNNDPKDLARQATVTTSSNVRLHFPEPNAEPRKLDRPIAQIFPVSSNRIETVGLLFKSSLQSPQRVKIGLRPAAHAWDFRSEDDLATAEALVPAASGEPMWVDFPLHASVEPNRLYYVYTQTILPDLAWAKFIHKPGTPFEVPIAVTPADKPGKRFRRVVNGTCHTMRITPDSNCFEGSNVISGTNRADAWTNLWISDPVKGLPATIELNWSRPVSFTTVQITFDTNQSVLERDALFRHPDCVRDYDVEAANGSSWKPVASDRGNYHRRRVHHFDRITTDRLKIKVLATNGAPSARIYEIRVYDE